MSLDRNMQHHQLRVNLEAVATTHPDFWSFRGRAIREHGHAYFQYPAMMVPAMQGLLIEAICEVSPTTKSAFDPFVGSGTTMTEAMIQGLDFTGWDINPLAALLCHTKTGPFDAGVLRHKANDLMKRIEGDSRVDVDVTFRGLERWFCSNVAVSLARIRRAIRADHDLWSRRFFWVAIAETVRLTSNDRLSTFKLHRLPNHEIAARRIEPIAVFQEIIARNIHSVSTMHDALVERDLLENGYYTGHIAVELRDTAACQITESNSTRHDLLVTSPPYGDNPTTVPYGQYSYLPLQWIDMEDIDTAPDRQSWLATTHEIDHRSLGGTKVRALQEAESLYDRSPTLMHTLEDLKDSPRDRAVRVAAFCRDIDRCLDTILGSLVPDAFMVWTVGNRRVGGRVVPIDIILTELLCARGVEIITSLHRTIPTKRMPNKNQIASTMGTETILIMRKGV